MAKRLALAALAIAAILMLAPGMASAQSPSSAAVGTIVVPRGTTHGPIAISVGRVEVFGTVDGNVSVGVGEVDIAGTVTGNASVGVGQIVLTPSATVGGQSSVGIGQIRRLSPGESLPPAGSGPTMMTDTIGLGHGFWTGFPLGFGLGSFGLWAIGVGRLLGWLISLGFALLIFALFPRPIDEMAGIVQKSPGPVAGWGIALMFLAPPVLVILAITVVGIPLVLAGALALIAAKVAGYVVASLLVGRRLGASFTHGREMAPAWQIVIGSVLFMVVGAIPGIGLLLDLVVTAFGLGAAALTGFGTGRPWFRRPPATA